MKTGEELAAVIVAIADLLDDLEDTEILLVFKALNDIMFG